MNIEEQIKEIINKYMEYALTESEDRYYNKMVQELTNLLTQQRDKILKDFIMGFKMKALLGEGISPELHRRLLLKKKEGKFSQEIDNVSAHVGMALAIGLINEQVDKYLSQQREKESV